ncbi:hypothetical protein [Chitinophaga pinensis]|uniref:YknX-like C-terminal permuted SH3-like domain-containing protein n=1 Tax=Chitinophaga pinensis TaxID=79329 RepID=A0A5C6LRF3_9BACT|nr:hypothetical protein [Chitinophaga pinensis]TWV99177.1 hypothetical protein FEF09_18070 [Chitinophaga pinensis]
MVPNQALMPSAAGYNVFVIKNGLADIKTVKTGERNANTVHITEGLNTGDTVVISNMLRLSVGAAVQFTSIK